MALENPLMEAALERFAREVVVAARDAAIWWHDTALASAPRSIPRTAAPEVQADMAEMNRLAAMAPEVQRIVRHMVVSAVDTCIHDFLKNLDDLGYDGATLIVDGVDVLEPVRHELHGYPLTDEGWFARFSKYGEHGEPPVP
jgi:hypothetical protein